MGLSLKVDSVLYVLKRAVITDNGFSLKCAMNNVLTQKEEPGITRLPLLHIFAQHIIQVYVAEESSMLDRQDYTETVTKM